MALSSTSRVHPPLLFFLLSFSPLSLVFSFFSNRFFGRAGCRITGPVKMTMSHLHINLLPLLDQSGAEGLITLLNSDIISPSDSFAACQEWATIKPGFDDQSRRQRSSFVVVGEKHLTSLKTHSSPRTAHQLAHGLACQVLWHCCQMRLFCFVLLLACLCCSCCFGACCL